MSENEVWKDGAAAIIDYAKDRAAPLIQVFKDPEGIAPDEHVIIGQGDAGGTYVQHVAFAREAHRKAPLRRKGTLVTHTLASFINITNRDKRDDSVIFADVPSMKLTAVLDFHGPADSAPRFGEDRVFYGFELSKQLKAWIQAAGNVMDQKTFSRLIDDRLGDIAEGPFEPKSLAGQFVRRRGTTFATVADLVCFTRTIATKSTVESEELTDENTGDVSIQYKKRGDVKTPDGQPVPVPQAFALFIPVLNGIGATEFNIAVRLRYDISDSKIAWRIELHALDKYLQAAIEEAVKAVESPAGCGLPVVMGVAP